IGETLRDMENSKVSDLTSRVSELETQNAALLLELTPESTDPENPSPEGARQKAEKYDQIALEYAKLRQSDANHKQAMQELKNGYETRLRSWTGFAQSLITRVFPDAEKLRQYAFRTFLESEFSEEIL